MEQALMIIYRRIHVEERAGLLILGADMPKLDEPPCSSD